MKRVTWFLMLFLLSAANAVMAGQSAQLVCVQYTIFGGGINGSNGINGIGIGGNNDGAINNCAIYELRVTVASDSDEGRSGAFGIGAQNVNGQMAYWTVAEGWGPFTGGLVPSVDGYYPTLPSSREYVVYRGSFDAMCGLSRGRDFNIYAAHGALMPEKEKIVQVFAGTKTKVSSDHIRKVYIQMDATAKDGGKWGLVYSRHCSGMGMGSF